MKSSDFEKVILKSDFSRRFPDPLSKLLGSDSLPIEHNVLLCKAIEVPSGISKKPNPRAQRIDFGIYKDVRKSLEDASDPTFHLKNKGITILAKKVDYKTEDKRIACIYFGDGDGIVDGAHTYEIVLDSQARGACPDNQYVKFEIITGVLENMVSDIAGGLNTAVQVQEASLANLEGKFEWIKKALKGTPYETNIAYKQNEKKDFDIRDVISFLTLFNIDLFPDGSKHPKEAYVSKAKCLRLYLDKQDSYKRLSRMVKDILYLHDYIHINSRKKYNAEQGGRAGAMKGVYDQRRRGKFKFIFMNEEYEYKLYDGTLYPILGAMRFLVERKPGDDHFSWKLPSFSAVKGFFDKVAPEMISLTYNTSLTYGRKPNAIGKDDNHWSILYKTVALAFLEGRR